MVNYILKAHRQALSAYAGIVCLLVLFASMSEAMSFSVPERLDYNLTWAGIKTGEAVLEARKDGPTIQFISKATSSAWVSLFHKVDDLVVSTLKKGEGGTPYDKFIGIPTSYKIKLKEGGYRRDKEFTLDHTAKKAVYVNHRTGEKLVMNINGPVLDPLASFYYIRTLPLEVGKSVFVDVIDSKKLYKAEVRVIRKEVVETPAGTFNTILIKPIIKSDGIFHRRGNIFIWLTDDKQRIPVLLKTKVALGSVKAVLAGGKY